MKVPLLNFEGGPGVPLLNFRGVPGPTLNFEGSPGSRVPGSWDPGPTFTLCCGRVGGGPGATQLSQEFFNAEKINNCKIRNFSGLNRKVFFPCNFFSNSFLKTAKMAITWDFYLEVIICLAVQFFSYHWILLHGASLKGS